MSVEEVANTVTHGFGLILSIGGFIALMILALPGGDAWHTAAAVVYGVSLITLYGASTFYHTVITPRRKKLLQLADHCSIYLLIAGSYTPFLLTVLREGIGPGMLALVWSLAVIGIALKIAFRGRLVALSIVLYLAMGWIGILAAKPLYDVLGPFALGLVVAGGVSYTLGMIFFGWKAIRHHHAIFHVFVLFGSILHYIAVVTYIMPSA
ncbi:MAG: hemolysin III family protein [Chloracidobacterium sp.]|nr:hemolysin III family protein [Chloracidobacterium sp.]MCC6826247.1 hemolysin III family protein [Acidobacteriota bacterium]